MNFTKANCYVDVQRSILTHWLLLTKVRHRLFQKQIWGRAQRVRNSQLKALLCANSTTFWKVGCYAVNDFKEITYTWKNFKGNRYLMKEPRRKLKGRYICELRCCQDRKKKSFLWKLGQSWSVKIQYFCKKVILYLEGWIWHVLLWASLLGRYYQWPLHTF